MNHLSSLKAPPLKEDKPAKSVRKSATNIKAIQQRQQQQQQRQAARFVDLPLYTKASKSRVNNQRFEGATTTTTITTTATTTTASTTAATLATPSSKLLPIKPFWKTFPLYGLVCDSTSATSSLL